MKTIILSIILLAGLTIDAQYKFALHSNGNSQFFSSLDLAYSSASNGDTIYIPGGAFNIAGNMITIDKEIHLVGVGHYPDSTSATYYSYLNGNIRFITGSDQSSVTGLYINGNINLGSSSSNQDVNHLTISRCNVGSIQFGYTSSVLNTSSSGHLITENVIRGQVYINSAQNVLITNNIISNAVQGFDGNLLAKNNIFLYYAGCPGYNINGVGGVFENNVFYNLSFGCSGSPIHYSTSCIFTNNLFTYNLTFPTGTNIGSGNLTGVSQNDVFVNHTGTTFEYTFDYHLNPASGGVNAGIDGTDIGIYGSSLPYKEGAVPFNPHIIQQNIDAQTDSGGNINVSIKVGAQDQ
ncbi:hypothetical protein [Parvicella tangerina]|uniref:Right handed beta helix domain-containing protein n=1 Tax=Parvicella tangerina TaxID=2829795 RepID=A0A916JMR7_9FLAO|nr:hypothetical protein [Parvicella tangerina]CAG5082514.1 hypothetical protein CRYO30217_01938 [Parvicella tangerina]